MLGAIDLEIAFQHPGKMVWQRQKTLISYFLELVVYELDLNVMAKGHRDEAT